MSFRPPVPRPKPTSARGPQPQPGPRPGHGPGRKPGPALTAKKAPAHPGRPCK
jgi:hypothetical protein